MTQKVKHYICKNFLCLTVFSIHTKPKKRKAAYCPSCFGTTIEIAPGDLQRAIETSENKNKKGENKLPLAILEEEGK